MEAALAMSRLTTTTVSSLGPVATLNIRQDRVKTNQTCRTAAGHEMASLTQNQGGFAINIFDEISQVNKGIDTIDQNLNQLKMLQQRSLDEADGSGASNTSRQLNGLSADTMAQYRTLTDQVRKIKSSPEAQQPKYRAQVGNVDRRLKSAIQAYQQVESQYRKRTQDQMARQFRIVRPDASEDEVRAAVEDQTGGQVFQQALMQSNRRGQAQAVLSAVQDRHAQLQKIEQQLMELAQLFQDLDTLVIQQDVAVMNIEQKAEETVENLDKGNEEVGVAIKSARGARKKKWICFGICSMYSLLLTSEEMNPLLTIWTQLPSLSSLALPSPFTL